jgi:hypothetical protein
MYKRWDMIKRANLWIIDLGKVVKVQGKGIEIIFGKIIAKKFTNFGKDMNIQMQEVFRIPNRNDQKRISPNYIILKLPKV